MSSFLNLPNQDIIKSAEVIASEKGVSQEIVFTALENAFKKAIQSIFGESNDIVIKVSRSNGSVAVFRKLLVVENVENQSTEVLLDDAKKIDKTAEQNSTILEEMPAFEITTSMIQSVKSSLIKDINSAVREAEYNEFLKLVGQVVSGVVKKIYKNGVLLVLGRSEAFLHKREMLPQEANSFRIGDKITAYIKDVKRSDKDFQVLLSRTEDNFLRELLRQEIPEIDENHIEIKAVVRDAGSRSKVAVFSHDKSRDPVGTCIGVRGKRIQAITGEFKDERIDIIEWNSDPVQFLINALKSTVITKISINAHLNKISVVLPPEAISAVIGRKGQNVKLISKLVGYEIEILTDDEDSKKRIEDFDSKTQYLVSVLDIDEIVAQLLISDGLDSIDSISKSSLDKIAKIEGFNNEIAEAIQQRAKEYVSYIESNTGLSPILNCGLSVDSIIFLSTKGFDNISKIADLSSDELLEELSFNAKNYNKSLISDIILKARQSSNMI